MHTIFLVDDDEDDRVIFTSVLKTLKVPTQCYIAHDGLEALSLLQNDLVITPDLIFLDLNMPKLNGFGFLKEVKKISGIRSIPVFIYTTSNSQRDINESFRLGAYGFVTKPPLYNELGDVLKNILEDRMHPLRNSKIIFNKVLAGIM
jgi:CheY-like chemotaxis protein